MAVAPRTVAAAGRLGLGRGMLAWAPQPLGRRQASSQRRPRRGVSGNMSPTASMAQMNAGRAPELVAFRIPNTFVTPPLLPLLRTPRELAKLLWYRARAKFTDRLSALSLWLQSKPGFLKPARFQARTKQLVPLAQSLHAQMLEATAAGDIGALSKLVTHGHLSEVAGLIARRPAGRRCRWELLAYAGRPKLMDAKVTMIPGPTPTYVRQAVVQIRSRQRFTWTDEARGVVTSTSERDVKENVILVATLDQATWETSEWRIFGFMPDTTVASWEAEQRLVDRASADNVTIGQNRHV